MQLLKLISACALTFLASASEDGMPNDTVELALAADDTCLSSSDPDCALNALQVKKQKVQAQDAEASHDVEDAKAVAKDGEWPYGPTYGSTGSYSSGSSSYDSSSVYDSRRRYGGYPSSSSYDSGGSVYDDSRRRYGGYPSSSSYDNDGGISPYGGSSSGSDCKSWCKAQHCQSSPVAALPAPCAGMAAAAQCPCAQAIAMSASAAPYRPVVALALTAPE
eukprot:CAMPEP_0203855790 /NCGR_PEP_ID=MMETSP0359-20131031/9824_1 /ASSEMBLY_ACC=CAM_ASM_000338 /TAXON_ID=268821 /ORGANISM="Scrippsiella Hangoei, Strain SHTV-5" /LENGTH=219 /DNA_ID=CAMNT_0050772353 /DNA_START=73 /DNA_END=733 /DNA_ORIENTATION=-